MKYKKYIIVVLIISLVFYCRHKILNHNIPIANIEFVKIEKDKEVEGYYDLFFSSDIELIERLQKKHLGGRIDCFFKNRKIEKSDYADYKGYILSSVGSLKLNSKTTKYNYVINTFFKRENNDSLSNNLHNEKKNTLKEILKQLNIETNCISCAVTAITMFNVPKRYISNTMCLPKEEIKKIIK